MGCRPSGQGTHPAARPDERHDRRCAAGRGGAGSGTFATSHAVRPGGNATLGGHQRPRWPVPIPDDLHHVRRAAGPVVVAGPEHRLGDGADDGSARWHQRTSAGLRRLPGSTRAPRRPRSSCPCGSGPVVRVSGQPSIQTTVSTTVGAILDGAPPVPRRAARHPPGRRTPPDRRDLGTYVLRHRTRVGLARFGGDAATPPTRVLDRQRPVRDPAGEHRSENAGARGELQPRVDRHSRGRDPSTPVRVDGWRQAWVVPPGAAGDAVLVVRARPELPGRSCLRGRSTVPPRTVRCRARRPAALGSPRHASSPGYASGVVAVATLVPGIAAPLGMVAVARRRTAVGYRRRWRPQVRRRRRGAGDRVCGGGSVASGHHVAGLGHRFASVAAVIGAGWVLGCSRGAGRTCTRTRQRR